MQHLRSTLILIALAAAAVACGPSGESGTSGAMPTGDDFPTFEVIDSSRVPGEKYSLDVRLEERVDSQTLSDLARALRDAHGAAAPRVFISYYLPGMRVGSGAWATTHFLPDLQVTILGATPQQAAAMPEPPATSAAADGASENLVGEWLDEAPYVTNRLRLVERDGRFFMRRTFVRDGSGSEREVIPGLHAIGTRYSLPGDTDFYVLDGRGDLQLWDDEGHVRTARRQ